MFSSGFTYQSACAGDASTAAETATPLAMRSLIIWKRINVFPWPRYFFRPWDGFECDPLPCRVFFGLLGTKFCPLSDLAISHETVGTSDSKPGEKTILMV